MSDNIKLVIEKPKKTVEHIRSNYGHGCKGMYDDDRGIIVNAIYNGKPLSEVLDKREWIPYKAESEDKK